jgi:hypothetical protein
MSQSHLYLVRVWSMREGFRADVREVSSEDTRVFLSHHELAQFLLERTAIVWSQASTAAPPPAVNSKESS